MNGYAAVVIGSPDGDGSYRMKWCKYWASRQLFSRESDPFRIKARNHLLSQPLASSQEIEEIPPVFKGRLRSTNRRATPPQ